MQREVDEAFGDQAVFIGRAAVVEAGLGLGEVGHGARALRLRHQVPGGEPRHLGERIGLRDAQVARAAVDALAPGALALQPLVPVAAHGIIDQPRHRLALETTPAITPNSGRPQAKFDVPSTGSTMMASQHP